MADKIKARICFASLICVMVLLLTSCDFHIMSKREVEEYLKKRYDKEFTVLSSESVTDDYYDDDVWRVKAYIVSPKDDPNTCFYAYNIVEGESFGVPGFRNSLRDTYSFDIFAKAFETWAADTDVEYTFSYSYPIKSSSVFYSFLRIKIEQITPENLETVCTLLSQAYADTFEIIQDIPSYMDIMLTYRDPAWPEDQSCSIWLDSYELSSKLDTNTSADAIEEYILSEASWYEEKYIQAQ